MPKMLKYSGYMSHDRQELALELLLGAIDVRVVHLHGAHAHEAEELAGLLVAVAGPVLGQAQGQSR